MKTTDTHIQTYQAGDMSSVPGLGRSLEKEAATHFSILSGKSHGQRSLVGYSPRGRKGFGHNLATKQQQQHIQVV